MLRKILHLHLTQSHCSPLKNEYKGRGMFFQLQVSVVALLEGVSYLLCQRNLSNFKENEA